MSIRAVVGLIAIAGCHRDGGQAVTPDHQVRDSVVCARGGVGALYSFSYAGCCSPPAATDEAQAAYDRAAKAMEAEDHVGAARGFLACAEALRAVPESYDEYDHVEANAETCYQGAAMEYGTANQFEAEGRARFEKAAQDDPRMAETIQAELATTHDCAP